MQAAAISPEKSLAPTPPVAADDALRADPALVDWLLRLGDAALIHGHRISEWCGRGPAIEEDIALANTALDLIGHAQMWLSLAAALEGKGRSADDLAFLRDAHQFRNPLLVELPKGDIAFTLMREFLFDAWHHGLLSWLAGSASPRVAEIAAKALKEVSYHLERSAGLVVRLGDGTEESNRRMQAALDVLWPYTGEMFETDAVDEAAAAAGVAPLPSALEPAWLETVEGILAAATLTIPAGARHQTGGRRGRHTEHLGYLLAEMQFLQRAYPGARW